MVAVAIPLQRLYHCGTDCTYDLLSTIKGNFIQNAHGAHSRNGWHPIQQNESPCPLIYLSYSPCAYLNVAN